MKNFLLLFVALAIFPKIVNSQTNNTPPLEQLVKKYAPMIWHSADARYLPSSVEWFLDRSALMKRDISYNGSWYVYGTNRYQCALSDPGCRQRMYDDAKTVYPENHQNKFQVEAWNMHRLENIYSPNPKFGDLNSARVYVKVQLAHHQKFPRYDYDIEIQYWIFYPYNGAQITALSGQSSSHEGDWEGVSVILDSNGNFKYVIASEHNKKNHYQKWQLQFHGTHPILYSARFSHALYNTPGCHNTVLGVNWDCIEPWNGVNQFKTWNAYEIIDIDKRMKNHGVTPTQPGWMYFGGKWGDTYSKSILGVAETSGSPSFKEKIKEEWNGTSPYPMIYYGTVQHPDWTYDYTINGNINTLNEVNNLLSGPNSLCDGSTASYRININRPKSVSWNAPQANFSPHKINHHLLNSGIFRTTVSGSGTKQIKANVIIYHTATLTPLQPPVTLYETTHNFSKSVTIANPTSSKFSLSGTTASYGSTTCITSVSLINTSGISPSSVRWTVSPGHTIQSSNNNYAHVLSPKGSQGNVTAEITVCNKTILSSTLLNANCSNDDGGIDGPGGPIGFQPGRDLEMDQNQIFPNPTSGIFRVTILNDEKSLKNVRTIVSDYSGRKVKQIDVSELKKSYIDMDVSDYENGLYMISVFSDNVPIYRGKLIKK